MTKAREKNNIDKVKQKKVLRSVVARAEVDKEKEVFLNEFLESEKYIKAVKNNVKKGTRRTGHKFTL